ncbi:MAG: hypothetical protein ACI9JK_000455 [Phycisphaerales bacterium]|jgi:hypothetical protein
MDILYATKVLNGIPHSKTARNSEWYSRARWQEDSSLHIGPVIPYYQDDALNGTIIWGFRTSYSF